MNLLLYIIMAVLGLAGTLHELLFKRTAYTLLGAVLLLYVVTMCSRIGYSNPEVADLNGYIEFFQDANESYFEPGYVFVTDLTRWVFGNSPYVLLSMVSLWIISFVMLAGWIVCKLPRQSLTDLESIAFYPTCLFFVFSLYWGSHFGSETLRIGMATSLLFCSCALAINHRTSWAFLFALFAILFHTTAIIFALFVLILSVIPDLDIKQFSIWFVIMLILDVLFNISSSYTLPYISQLFETIEEVEMLTHYSEYSTQESDSYFNTQYLTYHLFGLAMIFGDLSDTRYNKAVKFYFVGLAMGTIFQSILVAMRIQWLFLAMIAFVLYFFVTNEKFLLSIRISVLTLFAVIQQIMLLRVLGWHI